MDFNLYSLTKKLRDKLIYEISGRANNMRITDNEILYIRKGIRELKDEKLLNSEQLKFLGSNLDYDSIFNYFISQSTESKEAIDCIYAAFDETLIFLQDSNFEVVVKKIQPSYLVSNYHQYVTKMMSDLDKYYDSKDLPNITTTSSTLLQTVFKHICEEHGIDYNDNTNFDSLYKKVARKLNLIAEKYRDVDTNERNKDFREFASTIQVISTKINRLRNLYSSSHGVVNDKLLRFNEIADHHLKMLVDITKTICNFIIGSNEFYKSKNPF